MTDLVELVTRSLSESAKATFLDRVEARARALTAAIEAGELDNDGFSIGLEMEVYAIDRPEEGRVHLATVPGPVFESGAGKELGLHNAELNTDPDAFDADGLARQANRIEAAFESAQEAARNCGRELVLDAMWTLPPVEGSEEYLTAVEERSGVVVADNMRADPRYVAIDNQVLRNADGSIPFAVPGVERAFPTILFESLATSIQPHLLIPSTDAFPAYYNVGIRTLGPVLALSTNSPFLPPDLYTDVDDPRALLAETHHELRIAVFEQSVNQSPNDKVRVPGDVDATTDTVDAVVEDDLCAPFLREWIVEDQRDSFADDNWEFDYKRSTYWRWLRCVVGGQGVAGVCDERSVRIEYRPLPTQPTLADVISLQTFVGGLLHGLVTANHPVASLPWEAAEKSFYSAAERGLDADLEWISDDGDRTDDHGVIFDELFEFARLGLEDVGVPTACIDAAFEPLNARVDAGMTPSHWKIDRVREGLDHGLGLDAALREMQAAYIERSRETRSFAEWL